MPDVWSPHALPHALLLPPGVDSIARGSVVVNADVVYTSDMTADEVAAAQQRLQDQAAQLYQASGGKRYHALCMCTPDCESG